MLRNVHACAVVVAALLALAALPVVAATPSAETETRSATAIPAKATNSAVGETPEPPPDKKTKKSALKKFPLKKLSLEKPVAKKPVPAPEPAPDKDRAPDRAPEKGPRRVSAGVTSVPVLPSPARKPPAKRAAAPPAEKQGPRDHRLLLSVPRLGLEDVLVGDSSDQAYLDREGIMHLSGTGFPYQRGSNTYIAGHAEGYNRSRIPHVFRNLHNIRRGDLIALRDATGKVYNYRVYERLLVNPSDVWVTDPVAGKKVVSLQTCFPAPSFRKRLIVRGELIA